MVRRSPWGLTRPTLRLYSVSSSAACSPKEPRAARASADPILVSRCIIWILPRLELQSEINVDGPHAVDRSHPRGGAIAAEAPHPVPGGISRSCSGTRASGVGHAQRNLTVQHVVDGQLAE